MSANPKSRTRLRSSRPAPVPHAAGGERLQKVLAAAGIASRRECETLILSARVEVDRQVVTEMGVRVDPSRQEIRVDGLVVPTIKRFYYLVNKPPGVLSTSRDPSRRLRVIDLIPGDQRLFTVGRLDMSSEGLILVTNDGALANRLAHPRYGIKKTYLVQVAGHLTRATLDTISSGIHLAEAVARPARIRVKGRRKQSTTLEIVLTEGRNREIRRMLAHVGHKVMWLRRVALGPLRLGHLSSGAHRPLEHAEIRALQQATEPATASQKAKRPRSATARKRRSRPAPKGRRR